MEPKITIEVKTWDYTKIICQLADNWDMALISIRTLLFVKFIKHGNNTTCLVPWEIDKDLFSENLCVL